MVAVVVVVVVYAKTTQEQPASPCDHKYTSSSGNGCAGSRCSHAGNVAILLPLLLLRRLLPRSRLHLLRPRYMPSACPSKPTTAMLVPGPPPSPSLPHPCHKINRKICDTFISEHRAAIMIWQRPCMSHCDLQRSL